MPLFTICTCSILLRVKKFRIDDLGCKAFCLHVNHPFVSLLLKRHQGFYSGWVMETRGQDLFRYSKSCSRHFRGKLGVLGSCHANKTCFVLIFQVTQTNEISKVFMFVNFPIVGSLFPWSEPEHFSKNRLIFCLACTFLGRFLLLFLSQWNSLVPSLLNYTADVKQDL